MKLKDAFPSRFLKADDFEQPRLLTISKVTTETVKNDDGEAEKVVAWFEELEQGLVVNKTNFAACINITGHEDSDDWLGQQVVLARETVAFGGRMVPAIRVKKPRKAAAAAIAADFDDPIP